MVTMEKASLSRSYIFKRGFILFSNCMAWMFPVNGLYYRNQFNVLVLFRLYLQYTFKNRMWFTSLEQGRDGPRQVQLSSAVWLLLTLLTSPQLLTECPPSPGRLRV